MPTAQVGFYKVPALPAFTCGHAQNAKPASLDVAGTKVVDGDMSPHLKAPRWSASTRWSRHMNYYSHLGDELDAILAARHPNREPPLGQEAALRTRRSGREMKMTVRVDCGRYFQVRKCKRPVRIKTTSDVRGRTSKSRIVIARLYGPNRADRAARPVRGAAGEGTEDGRRGRHDRRWRSVDGRWRYRVRGL